ncbi:MAG: alanine--tRNA ligase-related protein, partial [Oscillospiraceae bacterium]|nr:alanine--tRNA ligase-related protein [Oscillospiraceae bacterium]
LLAATYGFPIDLTIEMVEDEGMTVDLDEYNRNREEDKIRAREARKALGDLGWAGVDFGKEIPETKFMGYDTLAVMDAKVVAMVAEEQQVEVLMPGMDAIVVLDKTPFYAEMGGQVADHGFLAISGENGMLFEVTDVQKNKGGKYMHYGKVTEGTLNLGDTVRAHVDAERRTSIMRAHSATHLLDAALRSVLGDHVHQAGSLVMPDRLRFDFTHFSAMTAEELEKVNNIVNGAILSGYEIVTEEMPIEQAKQRGAIALFGEKYGDTVRVVDMGNGFSVEFCGGTHQDNTAKIGPFRIVSEASVASGVRRIEAITGNAFVTDAAKTRDMLSKVCAAVKVKNPADLEDKLTAQLEEIKALKKEIEQFKAKEAAGAVDQMIASAKAVGAVKVLTAQLPGADAGKLRQTGDV